MEYRVNIPYPEVKVEKKDIEIAKDLLDAYAGRISEDSAVHDYVFQMMMQDKEELKKILRGIAIVEMGHIDILGRLIYALGLTPLFASVEENHTKWFSGEYVNYEKNWEQTLRDNIYQEEAAIRNYEKIILKTNDVNVKHILKRIILDERVHIEIFTKLLEQKNM